MTFSLIVRRLTDNNTGRIDQRFNESRTLIGHVDVKRLVAGASGGVFMSAYVDCPKVENNTSDEASFEALRDTLQQIDLIHRLVERYSGRLELVHRASDIMHIFNKGKIAVIPSIEGLHQVANSSSVLRNYHRLGIRCATLVHNKNNKYAGSATSGISQPTGLSDSGTAMILEMNRLGMIIDLSHASEETMNNVLDHSTAPVVFTHSSCHSIVPHARNVTDAILHRLKNNHGLMMVSLIPALTSNVDCEATVSHVVDHIMHLGSLIGYDHVGVGSDFDGMPSTIADMEDVSKFPVLVAAMLRRGILSSDVENIIGKNVIRVFHQVEAEGERLRNTGAKILEDEVKPLWKPELMEWCRNQWPNAQH
ncbi:hypothetical protein K504DRAFT_465031 [Pleomassaria siparia CBS 279.74]|uniref:Dipeptidase n=1 Tax=Pleomassaria siparia CBS 279.74 TaxID=1314801 RepID=A0A6G1KF58_9PLEO|nr:hypothetical protein K504DRAFT_465031 [Pleomassaria siparia CBS 279.74]